jgi:hypothetical protein
MNAFWKNSKRNKPLKVLPPVSDLRPRYDNEPANTRHQEQKRVKKDEETAQHWNAYTTQENQFGTGKGNKKIIKAMNNVITDVSFELLQTGLRNDYNDCWVNSFL